MCFPTGLFTYTLPQTGVGRVQSHKAVFACVYVCVGNVDSTATDQLTGFVGFCYNYVLSFGTICNFNMSL